MRASASRSRSLFDAAPSVFFHPDLDHVRYLMVVGTNPRISNRGHNATETFKELGSREGCTVVAVDPRETETTRGAHRHLRVQPGGDVYMLLGMAANREITHSTTSADPVVPHTLLAAEGAFVARSLRNTVPVASANPKV